jgi:dipeptidyl aminopeptidase/acylaminoacyl peptidase
MFENKVAAPYGTWKSPISAASVGSGNHVFELKLDSDEVFFVEVRPMEVRARYSLMKIQSSGGDPIEITDPPYNVRTTVHEYGGGAFVLSDEAVYFSNFTDQLLYKQSGRKTGVFSSPIQVTRTGTDVRYSDGVFDKTRNRLICVQEHHPVSGKRDAVNSIVSLDLKGSVTREELLISGNDFYSFPRLNSDGSKIAWITWNFPNMPFDGSELWVGDFDKVGRVQKKTKIAGGLDESVTQPTWSGSNDLYFLSDRTGWWNLFKWSEGGVRGICPKAADFCQPDWYLGLSSYAIASEETIVCSFSESGIWKLGELDLKTLKLEGIQNPFTDIGHVQASANCAVFLAASPTESQCIYRFDLSTKGIHKIYESTGESSDQRFVPSAISREFPTANEMTAHSFFYEPCNPEYTALVGELPPLVVMAHGGPTSAASSAIRGAILFFTSRGFAVLDVNYGGSSGFGREYRRRLNGQWGVVDVEDCVKGALNLVRDGKVDGNRMLIRGGSAGGFTTLSALASKDVFKAGACYYGISDLERWELDCHKFESQYLHSLIGAYPQERELFLDRSPTSHADKVKRPLILFQGLEDKVVPPSQSELMVKKLQAKNLPVEYIAFEEEQHDFRQDKNIAKALEAELSFFLKAIGVEKV